MTQENVDLLRRVLAAFNRGEATRKVAEELFDPDVRIEPLLAGWRGRLIEIERGRSKFVSDLNEIFEEVHADCSEGFGTPEVALELQRAK
jgi:hypothetical protein